MHSILIVTKAVKQTFLSNSFWTFEFEVCLRLQCNIQLACRIKILTRSLHLIDHFTQLIWRSSTHFGIGKARTRQGKMIVVANYTPPGNVSDHFAENVPPPLFGTLESRRNTAINATLETNRKIIERSARKLRRKRRLTPVITTISGSHIDSSL